MRRCVFVVGSGIVVIAAVGVDCDSESEWSSSEEEQEEREGVLGGYGEGPQDGGGEGEWRQSFRLRRLKPWREVVGTASMGVCMS